MPFGLPDLSAMQFERLCVLCALLGLCLLFLWPEQYGYEKTSILQAFILPEGHLISLEGTVSQPKLSASSPKFKLCSASNDCISVLFDSRKFGAEKISALSLRENDFVRVFAEVSSVQGNKFVRAHVLEAG